MDACSDKVVPIPTRLMLAAEIDQMTRELRDMVSERLGAVPVNLGSLRLDLTSEGRWK